MKINLEGYDLIIPSIIILFIIIGVLFELRMVVFSICRRGDNDKKLINYTRLKMKWMNFQIYFLLIYYCVLISSLLAPLLIIFVSADSIGFETQRTRIIMYSIISFLSFVVDKSINPYEVARAYRKAFELLNNVLLLEGNCIENRQEFEKKISNCIAECEKIISCSFYNFY